MITEPTPAGVPADLKPFLVEGSVPVSSRIFAPNARTAARIFRDRTGFLPDEAGGRIVIASDEGTGTVVLDGDGCEADTEGVYLLTTPDDSLDCPDESGDVEPGADSAVPPVSVILAATVDPAALKGLEPFAAYCGRIGQIITEGRKGEPMFGSAFAYLQLVTRSPFHEEYRELGYSEQEAIDLFNNAVPPSYCAAVINGWIPAG